MQQLQLCQGAAVIIQVIFAQCLTVDSSGSGTVFWFIRESRVLFAATGPQ
jgi:hypothetical protein